MWAIKKLMDGQSELFITRGYEQLSHFIKMPVGNFVPIKSFIEKIVHLKLLLSGYSFLVGSCFEPDNYNGAIVLTSQGGVGKTTTILKLMSALKGKFLSDDKIIINKDGTIYAYPEKIRIRRNGFPFGGIDRYQSPMEKFGTRIKVTPSKVKVIFFLERASRREILKIDPEQAIDKLLAINGKILPYFSERTILAYSYISPSFRIREIMQEESNIIRNFVNNSDCYILRDNLEQKSLYIDLMNSILNSY